MGKLKNFGMVNYNRFKKQIEYTHFVKENEKTWKKYHGQSAISNQVYIPNHDAVANAKLGQSKGEYEKDLWGNDILVGIPCDFFGKEEPLVVEQSPRKYSGDIDPTVKFLQENFEFDPEQDEVPKFRIHYMDIETLVDDGDFLQGWNVGPDKQGHSRGGITLIATYDTMSKKTTIFGVNPYNDTVHPLEDNIIYVHCDGEKDLLTRYNQYLKDTDPDMMVGWNIYDYDMPYILNRMILHFGKNALYKFGNGSAWINNQANGNRKRRIIVNGIQIVDYLPLYKKFELTPRRSYKLSNICDEEGISIGGQGKITFDCSFREFYESDWNGFVRYCIQDARLVEKLDNKKKLIETLVMLCYTSGVPIDRVIGADISWIRIHDAAIYRFCKAQGLNIPNTNYDRGEVEKFAGAYVMPPETGVYDYVTVFDVASLYPSCIRAINISSDTYCAKLTPRQDKKNDPYIIEVYDTLYRSLGRHEADILAGYNIQGKVAGEPKIVKFDSYNEFQTFLHQHKLSIAANGTIYKTNTRGVIPSILDDWLGIRKKYKALAFEHKKKYAENKDPQDKVLHERYDTIQKVRKIALNSIYGYLGNQYSRFYDRDLAEAVTSTGQYVIRSTIDKLNEMIRGNWKLEGDFIFYADTDSCFLNYAKIFDGIGFDYKNLPKEEVIAKCTEIDVVMDTIINNHCDHLSKDVLNCDNEFVFETEEQIEKMLITSKKKYIARVNYDKVNKQFVDEYIAKGMEFKKSNLSAPVKKFIKKTIIKIMDDMSEEDTITMMKTVWDKIPEMPIDDIAYVQGCRNIEKYEINTNLQIDSKDKGLAYFPPHTPQAVKGAMVVNALIDYDPRLHDMEKMTSGDKGRIIYVTEKNLFGVKAITVSNGHFNPIIYEYFKLDVQYIFERIILKPLQPTLDAVKYNVNTDAVFGFKFLDTDRNYTQTLLFS